MTCSQPRRCKYRFCSVTLTCNIWIRPFLGDFWASDALCAHYTLATALIDRDNLINYSGSLFSTLQKWWRIAGIRPERTMDSRAWGVVHHRVSERKIRTITDCQKKWINTSSRCTKPILKLCKMSFTKTMINLDLLNRPVSFGFGTSANMCAVSFATEIILVLSLLAKTTRTLGIERIQQSLERTVSQYWEIENWLQIIYRDSAIRNLGESVGACQKVWILENICFTVLGIWSIWSLKFKVQTAYKESVTAINSLIDKVMSWFSQHHDGQRSGRVLYSRDDGFNLNNHQGNEVNSTT